MTRERAERVAECVSVWVRRERTIDGGRVEEGVGRRRAAARARRTRNQRHEVPVQRRAPASTNAPSSELSANRFFGNGGIGANASFLRARVSLESAWCRETVGGLSDGARSARAASNEPRSDRLAVSLASFSQRRCNASSSGTGGARPTPSPSPSPCLRSRAFSRGRAPRTPRTPRRLCPRCAPPRRARRRRRREDESSDPKNVFGFSSSSKRVSSSGTFVGNKSVGSVPSRGACFSNASPGRRDVVLDGEHRGEAPVRPRGRAEPEQRPEQAADQELAARGRRSGSARAEETRAPSRAAARRRRRRTSPKARGARVFQTPPATATVPRTPSRPRGTRRRALLRTSRSRSRSRSRSTENGFPPGSRPRRARAATASAPSRRPPRAACART